MRLPGGWPHHLQQLPAASEVQGAPLFTSGLAAQPLPSYRAEAERAFALAEHLGSVNAAAELGTTWPSLRKAFIRHGLGMPARNPEVVPQRGLAAASQRAGRRRHRRLIRCSRSSTCGQLPVRRGPQAEQGMRLRRAEEIEALSYRTVVELNAESRLAPQRRVAETLRAHTTDPDPAAGRQEPGDPPAEQERDREPEDDFGDSWRSYRERADHLRQTYGWTLPQPPPRAENRLPLGRNDLEHNSDREHRWPWALLPRGKPRHWTGACCCPSPMTSRP